MSRVEVRLAPRDSPDRARSLLTVRAAISSARFGASPRCRALSLMCSYWRSRLALEPRGMAASSFGLLVRLILVRLILVRLILVRLIDVRLPGPGGRTRGFPVPRLGGHRRQPFAPTPSRPGTAPEAGPQPDVRP